MSTYIPGYWSYWKKRKPAKSKQVSKKKLDPSNTQDVVGDTVVANISFGKSTQNLSVGTILKFNEHSIQVSYKCKTKEGYYIRNNTPIYLAKVRLPDDFENE